MKSSDVVTVFEVNRIRVRDIQFMQKQVSEVHQNLIYVSLRSEISPKNLIPL